MDKKKNIVEAALNLISTRPIEEVTMREIAKRAGVSLGLSYTYFQNKEDIISTIYQWAVRRIFRSTVFLKNGDIEGYLRFIINDMNKKEKEWRVLYQLALSPDKMGYNKVNVENIEKMLSIHFPENVVQTLLSSIIGISVMLLFIEDYQDNFDTESFIKNTVELINK